MRKHLSIFCLAVISLLSMSLQLKAQNTVIEDKSRELAENIVELTQKKVENFLNEPVIIVAQNGGDTIFRMGLDSIVADTNLKSIVINVPGAEYEDYSWDIRETKLNEAKTLKTIVGIGVIIPCITIMFIVVVVLFFLLAKNRQRNRIIYKAIENNYQLPESFYQSRKVSAAQYEVREQQASKEQSVQGMPPIPKNLPFTPYERKEFNSGTILSGIGLFIFLFFWSVGSITAGLLFGGIPFIIGATRLLSFFFFRNK